MTVLEWCYRGRQHGHTGSEKGWEGRREGDWRQGRVGPPELPRESPEPRFIQLVRQCKQWLNGDEKGAGVGRTAQGETAPHEYCALVKALFWSVLRAHKQTALLIGPITVTPLALKHICFSFLYYSDKTCDLLCMHRLQHLLCSHILLFIIPTPTRVKNNKRFHWGTAVLSIHTHFFWYC